MEAYLTDCTLCPRQCHADRLAGQRGYCGKAAGLIVARAALHMWEETCISGVNGSGTLFFWAVILGVSSARIIRFPETDGSMGSKRSGQRSR